MSIREAIKDAYRSLILARVAGRRLRHQAEDIGMDVAKLVHLAFTFENNSILHPRSIADISIRPSQVPAEITALAELVAALEPKCVVEIGTNNGGTLFLWSRLASDSAVVASVDLPGGTFGGGYPVWRASLYHSFKRKAQRLNLIRDDSHRTSTLARLRHTLGDCPVDFLFIDGDHTYEGVKQDFEMYSQLVRPGGIVAFHDILPHPNHPDCQVDRFWNEVKVQFQYQECVERRNQGWAGIGVLTMPSKISTV
jgi:predicted O-methyltransferase YrrM